METWLPVPGFEGSYEASSAGQIRRLPGRLATGRKWKGRIMRPGLNQYGYLVVWTSCKGIRKKHQVHVLVCTAFHGARPDGKVVAHEDGVKTNCSAANLSWKTQKENEADKVRHGTVAKGVRNGKHTKPESTLRGSAHGMAVLKEEDVLYIRSVYTPKQRGVRSALAKKFSVRPGTIKAIQLRRLWSHI